LGHPLQRRRLVVSFAAFAARTEGVGGATGLRTRRNSWQLARLLRARAASGQAATAPPRSDQLKRRVAFGPRKSGPDYSTCPFSELRLQLTNPSTSPNELNTTLTPHSMIHGDACFADFNKIWGIPNVRKRVRSGECARDS
jgi:hypothetical protein